MSEVILTSTEGHVGVATLNRPEVLNALSVELMDTLIDVLEGYDPDRLHEAQARVQEAFVSLKFV